MSDAAPGPWERYAKPAGEGQKPWEKFNALPAAGGAPGSAASALWNGLLHGLGNVGIGADRLAARAVPGVSSETVDQAAQQRQTTFEKDPTTRAHPTATAIGEVGGEMAATAPLGAGRGLASIWERLAQGAATGAATGAVGAASQAPGGSGFAPAVAMGAGAGAVGGAGAGALRSAAQPSSLAAPRIPPAAMVRAPEAKTWRDAARMLTSQDVRLSPMQARGMGEKERSLQEMPILRGMVRGAVGRSVDDFNRAVVSQALSPIGAIVPRSVPAGHDLMEFGQKQLGAAYDRVLPNVKLAQPGVANWLQNDPELQKMVSEMATDDAKRLTTIVENRLLGPLTKQGGVMDGPAFKKMESDLSGRAASLRGGNSDDLGKALSYIVSGVRDELANQNPQFAPELQKINHAFSMWARVRAAAVRDVDGKARFSPRDLLYALRGEDESAGNNSFGRGKQPMQAFAEAGSEIIDPSLKSGLETSKSAARMMGDVAGGAIGAVPYAAAMGAGAVPGVGAAVGAAGPGVGFEGGKIIGRRQIQRPVTQGYPSQ